MCPARLRTPLHHGPSRLFHFNLPICILGARARAPAHSCIRNENPASSLADGENLARCRFAARLFSCAWRSLSSRRRSGFRFCLFFPAFSPLLRAGTLRAAGGNARLLREKRAAPAPRVVQREAQEGGREGTALFVAAFVLRN